MSNRNLILCNVVFKRYYKFKPFFNYTDKKTRSSPETIANLLNEDHFKPVSQEAVTLQRQQSMVMQKRVSKMLLRSADEIQQDQKLFIDNHFGTVLNSLHALTAPSAKKDRLKLNYDYASLSPRQVESLINRTKSQDELVYIFDTLNKHDKLTRTNFIAILLNRALINQTCINTMLYKVINRSAPKGNKVGSVKSRESWSKLDFICFQVALTQKFFMLKKFDFIKHLVSLNFEENWIPFILEQSSLGTSTRLPYAIERSIWRIFFLFVKDYDMVGSLIRENKLDASSLVLIHEAVPKNLIYERHSLHVSNEPTDKKTIREAEHVLQLLYVKLADIPNLSKLQHFYLSLFELPYIRNSPLLFNDLKLISIVSRLSQSVLLSQSQSQDHTEGKEHTWNENLLTISNPLAKLLMPTFESKANTNAIPGNLKKFSQQRYMETQEIIKYNKILVKELKSFFEKVKAMKAESSHGLNSLNLEDIEKLYIQLDLAAEQTAEDLKSEQAESAASSIFSEALKLV